MTELETLFWKIFRRTMGVVIEVGSYQVDDLKEWDSLRHVELIFALEESFALEFSPDDIADLYSSTDEILRFLTDRQRDVV